VNDSLERRIADVIEANVRKLPSPEPDFYRAVTVGAARRRRRRRIGAAGAVCAAFVALIATVALVPALHSQTLPRPPAGPVPTRVPGQLPPDTPEGLPDFAGARPVTEVWPEAVRRLPKSDAAGKYIDPLAVLPGGRYLVRSTNNHDGPVAIFDPATRSVTPVTRPGETLAIDVIGIAADRVVWQTAEVARDTVEIWAARLDGGGTARLARPEPPAGTKVSIMSITDRHVIWGLVSATGSPSGGPSGEPFLWEGRYVGLYRVPVTGGPVEEIPDSTGFIPSWHLAGIVNTTHVWAAGPQTGEVWDLTTGERAKYTRNPRMAGMVCATLDWCGGRATSGHPAVQRLDGTGYLELPMEGAVSPLPGGRFARVGFDATHPIVPDARVATGGAFWDLRTGRVAAAPGTTLGHDGLTSYAVGGTYAIWEDGNDWVLLDFTRIA
jgi:hypothetical protein